MNERVCPISKMTVVSMLELENDAVLSVYDMAGDDYERVVYDVGIYT
jgi:hypothetical protein